MCSQASDPWKCSRQKRKMFSALSAEFIVEDERSPVQLYLQRLLTRHDVMITAGAGSRHLLYVHLSAGCYNQLDAFPLEVILQVFRLDAFPPNRPDHHGKDVLPDGTIHPNRVRSTSLTTGLITALSNFDASFPIAMSPAYYEFSCNEHQAKTS